MTQPIKFSDLPGQLALIRSEIDSAWKEILDSGTFIGGDLVSKFESNFARYLDTEFCIGVGNGTDALEIAFLSLELPKGSAVIVPANSFVATAEAALNVGLTVRFVDINDDFSIDLEDLASKIDEQVSCIVVVHLYGHPAPIGQIIALAEAHNLPVVEDCAQAHGAEVNGKKVGTFGSFGAFSFYPGKNLGAAGDAGALVTNDSALASVARRISNHGRLSKFDHDVVGRNSRLDSVQAVFLSFKLPHLDSWNHQRMRNALTYRENLLESEYLVLPPDLPGSVYHHFVVQTPFRDALKTALNYDGIECGIHYPDAIPDLVAFSSLANLPTPRASSMSKQLLSLPVGEHLGDSEIRAVSSAVNAFVTQMLGK